MRIPTVALVACVAGGLGYLAGALLNPAFGHEAAKLSSSPVYLVPYPGGVGVEWNCSQQPKGHWCHASAERRAYERSNAQREGTGGFVRPLK